MFTTFFPTRDILDTSKSKTVWNECVIGDSVWEPIPNPNQDKEKRVLSYRSTFIIYGRPTVFQAKNSRMKTVPLQVNFNSSSRTGVLSPLIPRVDP